MGCPGTKVRVGQRNEDGEAARVEVAVADCQRLADGQASPEADEGKGESRSQGSATSG
jgi:hypothetical protein